MTKPEHKIDIVCRVGSFWSRLNKSAKSILPTDKTNSFHPGDVIGQVVKASMGIIGNDGVAVEI